VKKFTNKNDFRIICVDFGAVLPICESFFHFGGVFSGGLEKIFHLSGDFFGGRILLFRERVL
jgi:hypothetical protein